MGFVADDLMKNLTTATELARRIEAARLDSPMFKLLEEARLKHLDSPVFKLLEEARLKHLDSPVFKLLEEARLKHLDSHVFKLVEDARNKRMEPPAFKSFVDNINSPAFRDAARLGAIADRLTSLRPLHDFTKLFAEQNRLFPSGTFDALTTISDNLIRDMAAVKALRLVSLPVVVRNAPVVEPYLSARGFAWIGDNPSTEDTGGVAIHEALAADLLEHFNARLIERGWFDIAESVQAAYEKVQATPDVPDSVLHFAASLRRAINRLVARLASKERVNAWVAEEQGRGTFRPYKGARLDKSLTNSVLYLMRSADGVADGYGALGIADLADCFRLISGVQAAGGDHPDTYLSEHGIDAVFERAVGFMLFVMDAEGFSE